MKTDPERPWLALKCPLCTHTVFNHGHHVATCSECKCDRTRLGVMYALLMISGDRK